VNSIARPARRIAMTVAAAGIAALGSVALAPAASAETVPAGVATIIDAPGNANGNGPDFFIVIGNRHMPVFFCDLDKPEQRADICVPTGEGESGRF
jgi:hypothetical protein